MIKKKEISEEKKEQEEIIKSEPEIAEAISEKIVEEAPAGVHKVKSFDTESWNPRTSMGKRVKNGEIKDIDEILDNGMKILEAQTVDILLPNLESDLLTVGQSKGKFGGGKRTIWRQVQKKTNEGNKPSFATLSIVGNRNGYIGMGYGKAKETVPAREKALRNAKLNIIKIRRGCGSWECNCREPHSLPYTIYGKSGSVKIYSLAGFKDVYSKSFGKTVTKLNLFYALWNSLIDLSKKKVKEQDIKTLGLVEGRV